MALLKFPTRTISRQLGINAANVAALIDAPMDAAIEIEGFVLGTAGEFAYLTNDQQALQTPPAVAGFPFYATAVTYPAGERLRWYLAPGESLFGLASVASASDQVWVSFAAYFVEPEYALDGGGGGGGGGSPGGGPSNRFRGPSVRFMKG